MKAISLVIVCLMVLSIAAVAVFAGDDHKDWDKEDKKDKNDKKKCDSKDYSSKKKDCKHEVPEFGTIAASLAVAGAGAGYLLLRRRN